VFDKNCAACHASARIGTVLPLAEVGTDRNRIDSWRGQSAIAANKAVKDMGVERKGLVEADPTGYIAAFLDGIWLKAPYLHNGSVPTLRNLLEPAAQRPKLFYRGYDVYDPANVGFISKRPEAERAGTKYEVERKGNGNQGHELGVAFPAQERDALIEFVKTH